jgi:hypothetical protein
MGPSWRKRMRREGTDAVESVEANFERGISTLC